MSRMNGKKTHTHTLHASSFPLQENDNFYPEERKIFPDQISFLKNTNIVPKIKIGKSKIINQSLIKKNTASHINGKHSCGTVGSCSRRQHVKPLVVALEKSKGFDFSINHSTTYRATALLLTSP